MTRTRFSVLVVLLFSLFVVMASAQGATVSANTTVAASLTVSESMSLSANGTFTIPPTPNTWSNQVGLTVNYNLANNHTNGIQVTTWFADPTQALIAGTVKVPTSAISMSTNGGGAVPCTGTAVNGSVAGATCQSFTSVPQANFVVNGSQTDQFKLEYTGSGLGAGTYTGTLNFLYYAN